MTGQTSTWGHYYDLASDAVIHISLFVCVGVGLQQQMPDGGAIPMGFLSGISVWSIFWFRMKIEDREGKDAVQQPNFVGFEMEDVLYLMPIVTLLDELKLLLIFTVMVSPWVAILFGWQYFKITQAEKS